MRKKPDFNLRDVCGEKVVVAEGKSNIDFCDLISMNETSAYLWEQLSDKDFTIDDMAELLTKEYDVDFETAKADSKELINEWIKAGIADE